MLGTFGRDHLAVDGTTHATGKITNINGFLYFSDTFVFDLAHLEGDHTANGFEIFSQSDTELADDFTSSRGRRGSPFPTGVLHVGHATLIVGEGGMLDLSKGRIVMWVDAGLDLTGSFP